MATAYELFTQRKALIVAEMEAIVDDLKTKHRQMGMEASGDWLKSLEVRETEKGAEIWGADYTRYLVEGRKPGKMPPKTAIVSWLMDKFHYDQKTAEKIQFPVRKKIADEGTEWFKTRPTDLLSAVINEKRFEAIQKKINILSLEFYKAQVRSYTKTLAS